MTDEFLLDKITVYSTGCYKGYTRLPRHACKLLY